MDTRMISIGELASLCFQQRMLDETSIERQENREANFRPPCCPRPECVHHAPKKQDEQFWRKHGRKALKRFPYSAQRFQCRACGITFTYSIFHIQYRQKAWGSNEIIWKDMLEGLSLRAIARRIRHSERLVRTRRRNFARWAELKHASLADHREIREPVVYDGLENFAFSQYDPNNINHAVGKKTLFIYDFNLCTFNRKGRMSPRQTKKKNKLDMEFGAYPGDAIRGATRSIFRRLLARSNGELVLYSDRHFQYRRVLKYDLGPHKVSHLQVSSKIHRNFRNPLFAVNNIDLMTRQNLAAFKRETIAFAKHEVAMQDSFSLYVSFRNYMRPKFYGTHRSDPECSRRSPAMELGITDHILSFSEFFSGRVFPTQVALNEDAKNRFNRSCPGSRRKTSSAPCF